MTAQSNLACGFAYVKKPQENHEINNGRVTGSVSAVIVCGLQWHVLGAKIHTSREKLFPNSCSFLSMLTAHFVLPSPSRGQNRQVARPAKEGRQRMATSGRRQEWHHLSLCETTAESRSSLNEPLCSCPTLPRQDKIRCRAKRSNVHF